MLAAPLTDAGLTPYRAVKRILPYLLPGATALVIGAGGLGQFAIQYIKLLTAARVVVLDISEPKLERAVALGADLVLDSSLPEVAKEIQSFTGNSGVAVVLDHVGSNKTLEVAASSVGPCGIIVQVGLAGGGLWFSHANLPVEALATYSWWGNRLELEEVVALARQEAIEVSVEHYPLDAINDVFRNLESGNVMGRAVLLPHPS
jgi:propanol-preferring alcohol dehydrogenase